MQRNWLMGCRGRASVSVPCSHRLWPAGSRLTPPSDSALDLDLARARNLPLKLSTLVESDRRAQEQSVPLATTRPFSSARSRVILAPRRKRSQRHERAAEI